MFLFTLALPIHSNLLFYPRRTCICSLNLPSQSFVQNTCRMEYISIWSRYLASIHLNRMQIVACELWQWRRLLLVQSSLIHFSYYNVCCAYRDDKLVTGQKLHANVIISSKASLANGHILGVNIAPESILVNKAVQFLGAPGSVGIWSRAGTGSI